MMSYDCPGGRLLTFPPGIVPGVKDQPARVMRYGCFFSSSAVGRSLGSLEGDAISQRTLQRIN